MLKKIATGLAAVGVAATGGYLLFFRSRIKRWGATEEEVQRVLPGDELVPHPNAESTRALTIRARASDIWSWVVQIGQGRGGYYSYAWLENLMHLRMENADQIHPEWQQLKVGDIIPAEPGGSGFRVSALEPDYALVLGGREGDEGVFYGFTQMFPAFTWAFVLAEIDGEHTRLITRWRGQSRQTQALRLMNPFFELAEFLMTRKMLLGIKQRAERIQVVGVEGEEVKRDPGLAV
jgi:hypothetical protein